MPHSSVSNDGRPTDAKPTALAKSPVENAGPALLIVHADADRRDLAARNLGRLGFTVHTARSGIEGIAIATAHAFDLMFVDLSLPDMGGLEMLRELQRRGRNSAAIAVSGCVTAESVHEAQRLGALEIMENSFSIEELSSMAFEISDRRRGARLRVRPTDARETGNNTSRPGSAAERWARYVLKGCESDGDLKTLADWARYVGVSYSSVRECCRLLDIQPRDARDLVRMLRAVMKSRVDQCPVQVLLDISDTRTLRTLMGRAGMSTLVRPAFTVQRFLRSQRFIVGENEGLRILRKLLFQPPVEGELE